ncbi:hypothetical protein M409DRAFT_21687 [Zasmidium cellare ATCC 36951]|uniref:SPX domain-containing protein n=1 Tax=Zasmidium cellare ATCC 36951 TaxID=1080233 RepID=A0A6A6CR48_ZASCE|nr:uncharacterized protein M409DRAFT_21687 [Zasmidium cellare ATCC 36951]KAF2168249.1 hypothetical protein M409DRAFT_21687 [Zasmidium cellare ATCC 36951]
MVRFGRTLEVAKYPPWKDHYIDYAKLKKLLREDDSAPSSPTVETSTQQWTEDDESKFVDELVNVQLENIYKFHSETHKKLTERVGQCEAKCDSVAVSERQDNGESGDGQAKTNGEGGSNGNGKKPVPSESDKKTILREVMSELDKITKEINELEKYSRINYTGFLKAAKKHDRKRGQSYRVRPLLQVRLAALPFNREDYGPLLFRLSTMYNFVRQRLDDAGKETKTLEDQQGKDEYTSQKFWVHQDNLLEVKTMILRHLPVLVYNPQTSKVAEGNQPDPSITSIYFDSPGFELYSNKVDHNAGSSLRLRWYGQLNNRPQIYVEKKTVGEDNTSREARFVTKDKYIRRFINGEYQMEKQIQKLESRAGAESEEVKNLKSSVDEIQKFIKQYDLQPVVRANYTRTAFQVPGEDRVRISLDTDLAFIREDALDVDRPCRDPENWHRTDIDNHELEYPFSSIRKGEISRFPFAVLEIKLRNEPGKKLPEWIYDIMNTHLVKEAPRFSKFVHGAAELFEDYVNTFPFWLTEMETDIRRDPQQAFEEEQAKRQKERDDEFAVGSLLKSSSHMSPSQRNRGAGVISPVGSPAARDTLQRSSAQATISSPQGPQGQSTTAEPTQMNDTAGEPDDDDTGTHTLQANRSAGGIKSFFHSTSKYAQSRRQKMNLPPGVSEPKFWIKDQGPNKVEGKVWLANQRTFIKWQHVSILLASLSLGLFNAAGPTNTVGKVLGVVYTCVAVFAAAWGYGIYMWRSHLIQTRSGKDFDAVWGPVVVCVGLIVALALNFGFKYHAVMQERNDHDTDSMLVQNTYMNHGDL